MTNPIWKNLFVVRIKHSIVDDNDHHHRHHHCNYLIREDNYWVLIIIATITPILKSMMKGLV